MIIKTITPFVILKISNNDGESILIKHDKPKNIKQVYKRSLLDK